jgi:hypothetical protein
MPATTTSPSTCPPPTNRKPATAATAMGVPSSSGSRQTSAPSNTTARRWRLAAAKRAAVDRHREHALAWSWPTGWLMPPPHPARRPDGPCRPR